MEKDLSIEIKDIGKRYRIGVADRSDTLRDVITNGTAKLGHVFSGQRSPRLSNQYVWALRHVSFEVKKGTALGIIGRNGAGKSTLLKILSRVTDPTEGQGELRGRVGSLLEVGTGFHAELSGRENIYLNGAILGMTKKEIDARFDQIVGFF